MSILAAYRAAPQPGDHRLRVDRVVGSQLAVRAPYEMIRWRRTARVSLRSKDVRIARFSMSRSTGRNGVSRKQESLD